MLKDNNVNNLLGKIFNNIADGLETGLFGKKVSVGLTILGSEHGIENLIEGGRLAAKRHPELEVVLIGPKVDTTLRVVEAHSEDEAHNKMEKLLKLGEIDACVTMHYNFPIGVATVGKVITPGLGKEMLITTTTGTSSSHRTESMVKNALYGIITAKALGIKNPTIGILNVDGARQVERVLRELNSNGYLINFTESGRSDGGSIMRGNDLLTGTPDIMVQDSLTGNLLMKIFSAFNSGGNYEALGYGYGPGIGENYENIILILSRASGIPVVANAIQYAADLVRGNLKEVLKKEMDLSKKANLDAILKDLTKPKNSVDTNDETGIIMPPKEVVAGSISGIDIMDLEDAVKTLWKKDLYAESGMGCTGPIVMVNEERLDLAIKILEDAGFVSGGSVC